MFSKKMSHLLLSACFSLSTLGGMPINILANDSTPIIADWRFSSQYVLKGSLEEGNMMIKDESNNGNHLELVTTGDAHSSDVSRVLEWSEVDYYDDAEIQSLQFNNRKGNAVGRYFKTVDEAPINSEVFEDGFTIEVLYKFPESEIGFDPWMGILTRQGAASEIGKYDGEKEVLSTLSVSNIPEFQWSSHPVNATTNYTNWSMPIHDTDHFQYITIVNDGSHTEMYINGIKDIRDPQEVINGIDVVPGKGWMIGGAEWDTELSKLLSGNLERIRIADVALPREDWMIQDPEVYLEIEGSQEGNDLLKYKDSYNFAFIPDTQYMVEYKPEMFEETTKWLVENSEALNLKMTAHLGDITQSGSEIELSNADEAFKHLDDSNIPYLITPGNHDYKKNNPAMFEKYFGSERIEDTDYYGGAADSSLSMYGIVEAGSYEYLFLSLDTNSRESLSRDIAWAKDVLAAHPHNPTIIFTHDAYYPDNGGIVPSNSGRKIWDELVNSNDQVFMVIGGHYSGSGYRMSQNAKGHDVLEMLVDYQSFPSGGNGWMRLAQFNERKENMTFTTYSPWIEGIPESERTAYDLLYLNSSNDQFAIPWDFAERFSFAQDPVSIESIKLNKNDLKLKLDKEYELKVNIKPSDAKGQALIWSSSNEEIVTVNSEGNVTPISEGTAVITVTTVDGRFSDTCEVTVINK